MSSLAWGDFRTRMDGWQGMGWLRYSVFHFQPLPRLPRGTVGAAIGGTAYSGSQHGVSGRFGMRVTSTLQEAYPGY
jgi:hypothetical protein